MSTNELERICVACSSGYYGANCLLQCRCDNGASCEPITGRCNCTAGWMGHACDQRTYEQLFPLHGTPLGTISRFWNCS